MEILLVGQKIISKVKFTNNLISECKKVVSNLFRRKT